jgi:uncharacterized protein (TIGR03437 family)
MTVSLPVVIPPLDCRFKVLFSSPGLLFADGSGIGFANARNADGTGNSADDPALKHSQVTFFVTGVGLNLVESILTPDNQTASP